MFSNLSPLAKLQRVSLCYWVALLLHMLHIYGIVTLYIHTHTHILHERESLLVMFQNYVIETNIFKMREFQNICTRLPEQLICSVCLRISCALCVTHIASYTSPKHIIIYVVNLWCAMYLCDLAIRYSVCGVSSTYRYICTQFNRADSSSSSASQLLYTLTDHCEMFIYLHYCGRGTYMPIH